jgi:hypothetical protein
MAPYYYLVCQLAWNPYADGNAILDDYYQRCYGPAAGPMKKYWQLLEKTRNEMVEGYPNAMSALMIPEFYTPEVFAQLDALVGEAKSLTRGNEKFTQRVGFTESSLTMTKRLVEIRRIMIQFEGAKKEERETFGNQVRELWAALAEEVKNFPPYAINFKRIGGEGQKRVIGLHPSNPVKTSTLRVLRESGLDLE